MTTSGISKWLYRIAALALAGVAVALAHAPYIPRLLWEGYPSATWPAPGSFTTVGGGAGEALPVAPRLAEPDPGLLALFEGTDGRALLAARDGRLVMEHYAAGVTRDTRLNSYSLVKSLVAALALKAVAEGRIAGIDTPIGTLDPRLPSESLRAIPLCRLIDMRSGILFEPGGAKEVSALEHKDLEATRLNLLGPMARLHMTGLDGIADGLAAGEAEATETGAPCSGGRYSYQNVNIAIVGAALEAVYGKPLETLLAEKIWKPAGAADARWRRYDEGLPPTPYCCLYARPIDWLNVAQFLISNGRPGEPFLPVPLWRRFMGSDIPTEALHKGAYAASVYHNVLDRPGERLAGPFAYFFGSRGQMVYLMPSERLIAVRFGGKIQLVHSTLYGIARSLADATP